MAYSKFSLGWVLLVLLGCGAEEGRATAKAGVGEGGGSFQTSASGEAGESASAGASGAAGAATCDCGDGTRGAQLSLACACEHELCSTFAEDVGRKISVPHFYELGICAAGYRTLSGGLGGEESFTTTYDAQGKLVYARRGGVFFPSDFCASDGQILGIITIGGTDPAEDCEYCLVSADDPTGFYREESARVACTSEQLQE